MASSKVTSLDVARLAGVSQSAVSRVFTPGASASKKTVEKVRKAAEELGYRPNVLARAMVSGKSGIIGLVVAYLNNQFYPEALERLTNALRERGYHVLVFLASNSAGNVDCVVAGNPGFPGRWHHHGLGCAFLGPLCPLQGGRCANGTVQPRPGRPVDVGGDL